MMIIDYSGNLVRAAGKTKRGKYSTKMTLIPVTVRNPLRYVQITLAELNPAITDQFCKYFNGTESVVTRAGI